MPDPFSAAVPLPRMPRLPHHHQQMPPQQQQRRAEVRTPRGVCYHCGAGGHHSSECPKVMSQAEQAELVLRQTHPTPTVWGIVLDQQMRLKPASPGFPVHDSAEYQMLLGWTLIGVNGAPVKNQQQAMEALSKLARPGDELTLHCRSPLPEDEKNRPKVNQVCQDWRRGRCSRDTCKFLHQDKVNKVDDAARAAAAAAAAGKGGGKGAAKGAGKGERGGGGGKAPKSCFTCGEVGHNSRDCRFHQMQKAKIEAEKKKRKDRGGPCHPIGMSAAEAATDQLIAQLEGNKRPRTSGPGDMDDSSSDDGGGGGSGGGGADGDLTAKLLSSLQLLREELRKAKDALTAKRVENDDLRHKCLEAERAILGQQRTAAGAELEEDKVEKKLEKTKQKLDKLKEAEKDRQKGEQEKARTAVQKGISACSDTECITLSQQTVQASFTTADAWSLLGLVPGMATLDDANSRAKTITEEFECSRITVEACKKGLTRRIQLAKLAVQILTPGGSSMNEA